MKNKNKQTSLVIITLIFTLTLLTACVVPSSKTLEQNEEKKRIETLEKELENEYKDTLLLSESISMISSDGVSLNKLTEADKDNDELERFVLQDGQTFDFAFQLLDWNSYINEEAGHKLKRPTKEVMNKIDYNHLIIDEREASIDFINLRDFLLDEEEMILHFKADLKENEDFSMGHLPIDLNLKLLYGDTNVLIYRDGGSYATTTPLAETAKNRVYEDDGTVKGRGDISPVQESEKQETTWSKETYVKGEDTVIPINDGNIDDWDHILDDWELEEGIAEDGEGIYD